MSTSSGPDEVSSLDFACIDELDPSIADGSRLIYERELSMDIRAMSPSDGLAEEPLNTSSTEAIKVKLLTKGTEDGFSSMRIEFSSESDLFFHYFYVSTLESFETLREEQNLKIDFMELPDVLIKMFNLCIRDTKVYVAILMLYVDGSAKLDFAQNMEYKTVDLLSLRCKQSDDEIVQRHITFRYNSVKQKLALMQSRLHEINSMVKSKNPSLLLQMKSNGAISSPGMQLKQSEEVNVKRPFYA